uniref:Uncharacterized protein n=1 Tax=Glossina austeni TaxID=7395 RepID=A0A1A9VL84_GLOAU
MLLAVNVHSYNASHCAVNHAADDIKAGTKRIILETVGGLTSISPRPTASTVSLSCETIKFMPANGEDAIIISSTYNAMILIIPKCLISIIEVICNGARIWDELATKLNSLSFGAQKCGGMAKTKEHANVKRNAYI